MNDGNVLVVGNGFIGSRVLARAREVGFEAKAYDVLPEKSDFASQEEALSWAEIIVICLPTGLDEEGKPNTQSPRRFLQAIRESAAQPLLVSLESTVTPGFCRAIHKETGLRFAYCPERAWEKGEPRWGLLNIPRVLSATDMDTLTRAAEFYSRLTNGSVMWIPLEVAEYCKAYENCQRTVNILLAQELKAICEAHEVNVETVLRACETKPFGYTPYFPGEIGGECLPMAPAFLSYEQERLSDTPILRAAVIQMEQQWRRKKAIEANDAIPA